MTYSRLSKPGVYIRVFREKVGVLSFYIRPPNITTVAEINSPDEAIETYTYTYKLTYAGCPKNIFYT